MKILSKKKLPQIVQDYIDKNRVVRCSDVPSGFEYLTTTRELGYIYRGFRKNYLVPLKDEYYDLYLKMKDLWNAAQVHNVDYVDAGWNDDLRKQNLNLSFTKIGIWTIENLFQALLIEPLLTTKLYHDLPMPSEVIAKWKSVDEYATPESLKDWLISMRYTDFDRNEWGYESIYMSDFWCNITPRKLTISIEDAVKLKFGIK